MSTTEQADNGASLDAQRAALLAEAGRRGWELELVADAGVSARNMRRPGLAAALERLDADDADHLMAVRIDRLSRSVNDFSGLVRRAAGRWGIVLLSPALDLTDHTGRLTANVLVSVAEFESELIGARTAEGMRQRISEGVVMGRPRLLSPALVDRIANDYRTGVGASAIARELNAEGIPTAQGGVRWWPSTVRKVALTAAG